MKKAALVREICARFAEAGYPVGVDPADIEVRRTYAGEWQVRAGAWSWHLFSPKSARLLSFGGYEPANACAMKSSPGEGGRVTVMDHGQCFVLAPPDRYDPVG